MVPHRLRILVHIFIDFYELTMSCMEKSVDPDQLASEGAS